MPSLRIDSEQRFTCAQCARCCTRPWEIVVTPAEAEAYRRKNAGQWFRERADGDEGAARDPFEAIAGTSGFHKIRKREGGACGFLSQSNRCRLHEELGARAKPLTCRLFPYSFHAVNDIVVATASFACPTIVANDGEPISSGHTFEGVRQLRTEWFKTYPAQAASLQYVEGRSLDQDSLKILRASLLQLLVRDDGVTRMARLLDDLARPRVVGLADDDFAQYIALTAPFAARSEKPIEPREPTWSGRLMQRGFLFLIAATQLQIENKAASGSTLALRAKTFRLVAHFHGLGPGVGAFDLRLGRGMVVDLRAPDIHSIVRNYLRSSIQTLGTGVRPVVDELGVAVSSLNAACVLSTMKAAKASGTVDRQIFSEALVEAVDVTHADFGSMARFLTIFAGGLEALFAFGSRFPAPGSRNP